MDLQQYLTDIGLKYMSRAHRTIVHLSGGRVLGSALGMPVVELHTVGRKSGLPRSTMLTTPVVDGDRVVLVASKGGDDRDPDWYRNLVSHPEIELTMAGQRRPMRARRASAEEKAQLWPRVVAAYGSYAGYQRRTERDIPLVICEPRT
jgi:deazaflavin-dependent oxidoreductase (nitroreductase family)